MISIRLDPEVHQQVKARGTDWIKATLDQALQEARANLETTSGDFWRTSSVESLLNEQGIIPFDATQSREIVWPEEESVEEFLDELERWRSAG